MLEAQNATLEQKVSERTEELRAANSDLLHRIADLTILYSLSQAMTKTLEVRSVVQVVGDNLRSFFNPESLSISLLDIQTNLIHSYYEYDRNEGGYIDNVEPFPLGTGPTSKVITTRQPLLLSSLDEEIANGAYFPPELLENSEGSLTQSWLGVPITMNENALGVVFLSSYLANAINPNHLRLLEMLGSNVGVTIENARLFQAEQRSNNELLLINSIQQGLAAKLDFQAIIDLVGDRLREVFQTHDLTITWYE